MAVKFWLELTFWVKKAPKRHGNSQWMTMCAEKTLADFHLTAVKCKQSANDETS